MERGEVTEFIKKILGKSDALPYSAHFKGVSDEKFKNYSFEDLKYVLRSTEEGELAAAEIKAHIELALKMEKVRAEKRAGGDVSSFFKESQGEATSAMDEHETGADAVTIESVPQKSKEVQVVTLDSDPEDSEEPDDNCVSSNDSDTGAPHPKRPRKVELPSTSTTGRAVKARRTNKCVLDLGSREVSTNSCTELRNHEWYDEIHGRNCTTINAYQWCWKPLSHRCENNLFRILWNSPNVEQLSIFQDSVDLPADIELPTGLLKLRKLVVHREGKIDVGIPFRSIYKMATNLKKLDFKFNSNTEEDLGLLGEFDWSKLQRLTVLSTSNPSYLNKVQIENLLRVRAPDLEELHIGYGVYKDVSGELLENVLKNFSNLQSFSIRGQYFSDTDGPPELTINFPYLSQLKYLNLGGNYDYAAALNTDKNDENSVVEQESTIAKPFRVTLKFSRIFDNLETLIVGNMYHIDRLHLSNFPKLKKFCAGSPWHLSVVFPDKNARRYNYPSITSLQLPDGLKDASFVRNIPERFPNVKKCSLYLPSARVLRTFFNVMKDVGLKELRLKTQFDFSSTLESCLLDKVLPVKKASEECKKMAELEKCVKWDEFVDQHNIILPLRTNEEVQEFTEATGEYGLGALKPLDIFCLKHIPRIMQLPNKGSVDEGTNQAASNTVVKLGYRKYPMSTDCREVVQRCSMKLRWNNLRVPPGERKRLMDGGFWKNPSSKNNGVDTKIEASLAIQCSNPITEAKKEY